MLRGYQSKAVGVALEVMLAKKPTKSVVVLPTAGGKTHCIVSIVDELDGRVLVTAPSKELLKQNYSKFIEAGGEACIFSASMNKKEIHCKVIYATSASLKLATFLPLNIKHIIIDECHLQTQNGSKLNAFIKGLGIKNILGLTASPVYLKAGADGAQLKMITRVRDKLFNNICHVTQIKELVDNKYWSPIIYDVRDVKNSDLQYNTNGSDFTKESLTSNYESNDIDSKILKCLKDNPDRKSVLIFVPTVREAVELQKKIQGSEVVYSGMDDKYRDYVIDSFKKLIIRVVINVNILAVGFDHPQLDHEIGARPTASVGMWYQQVGRGVRIHDLKKDFLYSDLAGNVERFGKLEDITFQNIEGYGWGMFNGDRLLTGVPFWESNITTIPDLIRKAKQEKENTTQEIKSSVTTGDITLKMWFGKHDGKLCETVVKEDPKYVAWMLTDPKWEWNSTKMLNLKGVLTHFMRKYHNKHL